MNTILNNLSSAKQNLKQAILDKLAEIYNLDNTVVFEYDNLSDNLKDYKYAIKDLLVGLERLFAKIGFTKLPLFVLQGIRTANNILLRKQDVLSHDLKSLGLDDALFVPKIEQIASQDVLSSRQRLFAFCGELIYLPDITINCPQQTLTSFFDTCEKLCKIKSITFNIVPTNTSYTRSMFLSCKRLQQIYIKDLVTTSFTKSALNSYINNNSYCLFPFVFSKCSSLTSIVFENTTFDDDVFVLPEECFYNCFCIGNACVKSVLDLLKYAHSFKSVFFGCRQLTAVDLSGLQVLTKDGSFENMCNGCINLVSVDISNVQVGNRLSESGANLTSAFTNCKSLTTITTNSNTDIKVANANGLFYNCEALTSIVLDWLDLSSCTNTTEMFRGCTALTSISNISIPSCTNATRMFYGCTNLQLPTISNTSNIENAEQMLSSIKYQLALTIDFASATNISNCFTSSRFTAITINNMTNNVNANSAIYNCENLTSVTLLSTFKPTNANNCFGYNAALTSINGTIDLSNCTTTAGMFTNCTALESVTINNIKIGFTIPSKKLTYATIDNILDQILEVSTPQTLTIYIDGNTVLNATQKLALIDKIDNLYDDPDETYANWLFSY